MPVVVPFDWLSFTTDYGTDDGFVGACVGVMARLAPAARVIHVSHGVPRGDVRRGAGMMAETLAYLPPAVHVGVVDPGVGTARRGVAVVAGGSVLVGPDNGLLLAPAEALGGASAAYQLSDPAFWLAEVSATFHGRDIFAPVAAHVAAGTEPSALGPPVPLDQLVRLPGPQVSVSAGALGAEVTAVDHFGNVQLAAVPADLAGAGLAGGRLLVEGGDGPRAVPVVSTFAAVDPGEVAVITDSAGRLAVVVNGGSAAQVLGLSAGDVVALRDAPA